MENPTIDQYLLSTCLFIIDDFNEIYMSISENKDELKKIADTNFNEMDICVRIGYPFRQMAHFTKGDTKKKGASKVNHDIYVSSKDFKIEVKYLKNWRCSTGTSSSSKNWNDYQEDFNWLQEEIKLGNKGKRSFVIGWFNCVENFSQLIQLGDGSTRGCRPLANEQKISYFPFLRKTSVPTYTTDLVYNYKASYKQLDVNLIGEESISFNCIFLGNQNDLFHFAIYY